MKLILKSTSKIVTIRIDGVDVPARIWEGANEAGVEVIAFITRIAVNDDVSEQAGAEFELELTRTAPLTAAADAFPLRLIL
jgi:hypothetical protein